ncbi:MAG: TIGR01212 family radical SAM protein [Clostridiales bacterium]|nr:TIGR01212 family radical SAM protein [Clostridiales bacterium]
MEELYLTYAKQMRDKYGEKVYKLPVNLPATCPNRDGTKGTGGCIFCGAKGTGFENLSNTISVSEQLEINKNYIGPKYKATLFVAYFQNFTNTYFSPERMYDYTRQAAEVDGVVELCFATRPDCVGTDVLDAIKAGAMGKQVCIEFGLQSVNEETLVRINRGHTVKEYIEAVERVKSYGFTVGTHMILNLPWDSREDCIAGAKLLSELDIDTAKTHTLYIEKGTELCRMYEAGEIEICSKEEYIHRAVDFLEHLKPDISVQRLASRVPNGDTIFCNWGSGWWKLRDMIEDEMRKRGSVQGIKWRSNNG